MSLEPLREKVRAWTPGRGLALDPLHVLREAWPRVVGATVAANSAPLELSGTALVVATRSSAWSQQLQFLTEPITAAVAALPGGPRVERLLFRSGALGRVRGTGAARVLPASVARREHRAPVAVPPARDLDEAFARMRARMSAAAAPRHACLACGTGLPDATAVRCAPCAGEVERARRTALERLLFAAPWTAPSEAAAALPGLTPAEFDRVRRGLLQRWWGVLERLRRAARRATPHERRVASSYVLLQSRLPPDRLTPAIIRNLVGDALEAALWGDGPPAAK